MLIESICGRRNVLQGVYSLSGENTQPKNGQKEREKISPFLF